MKFVRQPYTNKRIYSRLKITLPVKYSVVAMSEDMARNQQLSGKPETGIVLDVGAGGLCMLTERPIAKDTIIRVRLVLPTLADGKRDLFAIVVTMRNYHIPKRYYVHACFLDMTEVIQDELISYVCQMKSQTKSSAR